MHQQGTPASGLQGTMDPTTYAYQLAYQQQQQMYLKNQSYTFYGLSNNYPATTETNFFVKAHDVVSGIF
jgi:hypothetical protein